MLWLMILAVCGATFASERYADSKLPVGVKKPYEEKQHGYEYNYINQFNYQGKYQGKCGDDGLYYMDESTFVFCTHQFAYMQPCPPGTRNSDYGAFQPGMNYNYRDFCDINLVDEGYGPREHYEVNEVHAPKYEEPKKQEVTYKKQYLYHGKYTDHCEKDGFYYKDADSFVMCSNGYSFVQPCAPGTRNSGYVNFAQGESYYYRDFCDINLVDEGYGVQHGYLGQKNRSHRPGKPTEHKRGGDRQYERVERPQKYESQSY